MAATHCKNPVTMFFMQSRSSLTFLSLSCRVISRLKTNLNAFITTVKQL